MSRIAFCCLALVFMALGLIRAVPADDPPKPALPPSPAKSGVLTKTIEFKGYEADPNVTLEELEKFAVRYDLSIEVNEAAFKADGLEDVMQTKVLEKALPAVRRTTLDALLRKLLGRVANGSGAAYLIRQDGIEITTTTALREEVWGKDFEGPFLPLVHAELEKKPLAEALDELSRMSGFNVVIDARIAEKAKTPVTARLLNTPLDTAVRLLADMADLKPFQTDNLLYVTTRENADRLEAQDREKQAASGSEAQRKGSAPALRRTAPAGM